MKPSWKTGEFWLHAIVQVVGIVSAAGFFTQSWVVQGLALVMSAASAISYDWNRSGVKIVDLQTKASESASVRTQIQ